MNDMRQTILEAFDFRHACKSFDPAKVVSDEDFAVILEAARLSPSSFGFEPWRLVVLKDQALKDKLFPMAWGAQNSLKGASHFVILLARRKLDTVADAAYISHIMKDIQKLPDNVAEARRAKYHDFQEHDFRLLESDRALFDWASKQTYIALANMLTAASLLKIDSCPIEGFQRDNADALLADEGIIDPVHFGVSVMASFGYRAEAPRHEKTRQPLSDVVLWK